MSKKEELKDHECCNDENHECCGGHDHECECEHDDDHECCGGCDVNEVDDQIQDLTDKLIRTQAEMINYRRRHEEEVGRMLKYEGEGIIKELLPIIDDFERAIIMDDQNLSDEVSNFLKGFKMMYANMESILNKHEIKVMECLHQPFDPTYHQAVLTDKNDAYASGVITEVLGKGYTYKDKVIRPAMVKVNE